METILDSILAIYNLANYELRRPGRHEKAGFVKITPGRKSVREGMEFNGYLPHGKKGNYYFNYPAKGHA
jgi:hypothetical protein